LDVEAKSREWITLGFESFGGSGNVIARLHEAVKSFFNAQGQPPVPLERWDSLSYPAWLATLQ
jgi:hypothetical protein